MYYTDIKHFEQLTEEKEERSSENDSMFVITTRLVSVLFIVLLTSL